MERGPTRMCSPYSVLGTPFRSLLFAPFVRLEKRRHLGNNTAPTAICSACLDETCSRGRRQLDGAPGVGERPLLFDAAPDSWVPVLSHPQPQRYKERPALGAKNTEREKNGEQFRTVERPESFHPVRHGGIECRCQGWPGPSGLFRDPCFCGPLPAKVKEELGTAQHKTKKVQNSRLVKEKKKGNTVILPPPSSWWEVVGAACGVGLVRGLRGATEVTKGVGVAKMEKETR
ncbi:hypothetical protein V8C43DRAFT_216002 [Trichoderma afarasin]